MRPQHLGASIRLMSPLSVGDTTEFWEPSMDGGEERV